MLLVQIEVNEMINKIDNGSRFINFTEFCQILVEKNTETDLENEYKVAGNVVMMITEGLSLQECFRVFSKDDSGCVPADELKFVLQNLPTKVSVFAKICLRSQKFYPCLDQDPGDRGDDRDRGQER